MSAAEYSQLRREIVSQSMPSWMAGFIYFSKFLDEDECLLEFSVKGIDLFVKRLGTLAKRDPEVIKRRAVSYVIAVKERNEKFPGIHARHVVSLWNMVDATLSEALARLLIEQSPNLRLDQFRKISFSIAQYQSLSETELMRLTVVELKRQKAIGRSAKGVRPFEAIFKDIGLDSKLTDENDRLLIELRSTRNVIVHNMGIADDRFIEDCPWLKLSAGAAVKVTGEQYRNFIQAASSYVAQTLAALMRRFHPVDK